MDATGKQLLNLMFKPGEKVCVSPNKFGYHSVPLDEALGESVLLVPTPESIEKRNEGRASRGLPPMVWEDSFEACPTTDLLLCALNPIEGYRTDLDVKAYRSFLVELDYGAIDQQIAHIKQMGVPYSALVFSGNKSIHCLITLDTDLPSHSVYYQFAEWLLATMPLADQKTKNPSRSIRIPGAVRDKETGATQTLVEFKGLVKLADFVNYLKKHPDAKPVVPEKREINTDGPDPTKIKPWVSRRLLEGLDPDKGRNQQWFAIAFEYALAGYSLDDTLNELSGYFQPERSFGMREWTTTVKSAFKTVNERN